PAFPLFSLLDVTQLTLFTSVATHPKKTLNRRKLFYLFVTALSVSFVVLVGITFYRIWKIDHLKEYDTHGKPRQLVAPKFELYLNGRESVKTPIRDFIKEVKIVWRPVSLRLKTKLTPELAETISGWPASNLDTISYDHELTPDMIKKIGPLPRLEHYSTWAKKSEVESQITLFQHTPKLTYLKAPMVNLSDSALETAIRNDLPLEHLQYSMECPTNRHFKLLNQLDNLITLSVFYTPSIESICHDFEALEIQNLEALIILGNLRNQQISTKTFSRPAPKLRELKLGFHVDSKNLEAICDNSPQLKVLFLGSSSITREDLLHLRKLKQLKRVSIQSENLGKEARSILAELRKRMEIRINESKPESSLDPTAGLIPPPNPTRLQRQIFESLSLP
ncbi:MAG: hypothetical protein AAF226_08390, partial [Verrucomicrobiota bacterium]